MIADARSLPEGTVLEADVCIVGTGAAGIPLALELARHPLRVLLLESGGLTPEPDAQALLAGESQGLSYRPLEESRNAGFGGSTATWSGWVRRLDPLEFTCRDWVPGSGWPFEAAQLDSFYARAEALCQVTPGGYDVGRWEAPARRRLPLREERVVTKIFQLSPPTRFGRLYRSEIAGSASIRVLLHATVVEIGTSPEGGRVTRLKLATPERKRLVAEATLFVLAAGGIENARLLLLSDTVRPEGLGNGHDLVGRYFMDHPYVNAGEWAPPSGRSRSLALYRPDRRQPAVAVLAPADEMLAREGLTGSATFFQPCYRAHPAFRSVGVLSLHKLLQALLAGALPADAGRHVRNVIRDLSGVAAAATLRGRNALARGPRLGMRTFIEPVPERESRVTLGEGRDSLGRRRPLLRWKLAEADRRSLHRACEILAEEITRAGIGELRVDLPEDGSWPPSLSGANHHMGTTRMHPDPALGVVDADCRVHGIKNLFIAGSSVFPTAGVANPTLTIVALALRLADHLKRLTVSAVPPELGS